MNPVLAATLRALAALGLMLGNGVVLIYMLRKVLGHMHVRLGPNRVGPWGLLQTTNDVIKLLTKEDVEASSADKWLFRLAPLMVFVPSFMAYLALSFSDTLKFSDLDAGLLFLFAVTSLVPLGIVIAGWASNSKWSLIGGMRAAGQQIAYEVPLLLSVLPIVLIAGSLNLGDIVHAQQGFRALWPGGPAFIPGWYIFSPQLVAFVLFMVGALAELNQTPFDMSEAESELIGGFSNEFSGMKFGFLFLAEFSNLFIMSALATTLFFGGWLIPGLERNRFALSLAPLVFVAKTYFGIFVFMWIRGTLPRVRIDQLLALGWKALIPLSLTWLMVSAVLSKLMGGVG